MEEKTHGAQRRVDRARQRRREAVDRLVRKAKAREASAEGLAASEDDPESEASPYREAEELARELYRGR
jgi:hypothetical protein